MNNGTNLSCSSCGNKVSFRCLQCELIFCEVCAKKHPSGLKQGGSHEIAPFHPPNSERTNESSVNTNGDQVVPDLSQQNHRHSNGGNNGLTLDGPFELNESNNGSDELLSPNSAASRYLYCPSHAGKLVFIEYYCVNSCWRLKKRHCLSFVALALWYQSLVCYLCRYEESVKNVFLLLVLSSGTPFVQYRCY